MHLGNEARDYSHGENGVLIHIVLIRVTMLQHYILQGFYVGSYLLTIGQIGIQQKPAVVIQRRIHPPFLFCSRRPQVIRAVMLNKLPNVMRQHLSIVNLAAIFALQVKIIFLSAINDRRHRNDLFVFLLKTPLYKTVVVAIHRNIFVENDRFVRR